MAESRASAPASRPEGEELMTPGEVSALFRVDPQTVGRWADSGRLHPIWTPGGHRRYRAAEVRALLQVRGEGSRP